MPLKPRDKLPEPARFRILATTDLHAHLFPYDYYADRPTDEVGLARTASLITRARAEVAQGLLLDNGDFLNGNPLGDHVAQNLKVVEKPHPMVRAMNVLGYDAGTLGNHDFDHGLGLICHAAEAARFPVVCGNFSAMPQSLIGQRLAQRVPRWVILSRNIQMPDGRINPLRVGITGAVPPQVHQWAPAQIAGHVQLQDMVAATQRNVGNLRAEGADLIVVLAHSGIGALCPRTGSEHMATAIAALPGVDVIIAGHSHLVFPDPAYPPSEGVDPIRGQLAGKPAVMAGLWGSHLGVVDLDLWHDESRWRFQHQASAVWPILHPERGRTTRPLVHSLSTVLDATYAEHAATLLEIRRPIGLSAVPLNSYFALVTETSATRLVAEAQAAAVARAMRGTPEADLPILSATAPFKAGGRSGPSYFTDIPPGALALRHMADLYPYPNSLQAIRITGAQVADWLEHAANMFCQLRPGEPDQQLIRPEFPCYNFDTIIGLTYQIDLSQPRRFADDGRCIDPQSRRISDLCLNGRPLASDQPLIMATNNYRAGGGGNFPGLANCGPPLWQSQATVRDLLIDHVQNLGIVKGIKTPSWRFRPLAGTSALFETSGAARQRLDDAHGLDLQLVQTTAQGFARFRLRL
ncbi:bifunctional 2',3'-cyclic-nucleotide 2'-phosphodiesterase/3'-nucleotidase [Neogemmobacter tilapiae]|uniref:2',3'-cyclic-nucleotide 2'-phosphodiesterase n=1 Tax=Neogemmobacter tilapiae TaxID=875041 RepID=A0A918WNM6_9RHOB|nr:bifunctional 2',3'-cyclic-nucleotide 2'-phosphodiesterase/3'-nucleotidase [Gemmobacter tilapiae]GHC63676.1 2',3'-cyclic-nucleotide 2'-phosphodiesterase [Gemmobacter tilapiae]